MRWVCALGLLLALLHLSTSLLLGAFNIQTFGDKKSSNKDLMNDISKIVCRYHIILIQEVRDQDPEDQDKSVIKRLMTAVNSRCPLHGFKNIYSEPLGATPQSQERYVFLYRESMVSVVDSYQDTKGVFSRPPFIVEFFSKHTVVENFVLIPQHTTPEKAVKQINALCKVVEDVKNRWNNNNIVLLGDFNAGGTYVSDADWLNIRLSNSNGFNWLITDNQNTAVSGVGKKAIAYDRIVVTDDMMKGVVPDSAEVYNFMSDFGLTLDEASKISNHFPVEVTLIEKVT